jgi:hypothetical protein
VARDWALQDGVNDTTKVCGLSQPRVLPNSSKTGLGVGLGEVQWPSSLTYLFSL